MKGFEDFFKSYSLIISVGTIVFPLGMLGCIFFTGLHLGHLPVYGSDPDPTASGLVFITLPLFFLFVYSIFNTPIWFVASIFLTYSLTNLIVIIVTLGVLVYPVSYWFLTKMYQEYAQYPYQFRLSQWSFKINDSNKKAITRFISEKNGRKHLLIFGSKKSGKTSLGIGIMNELSIQHKACLSGWLL